MFMVSNKNEETGPLVPDRGKEDSCRYKNLHVLVPCRYTSLAAKEVHKTLLSITEGLALFLG